MKTSYLEDEELDWAVAIASGTPIYRSGKSITRMDTDGRVKWNPSMDWSQAGQFIERHKIELAYRPRGDMRDLHGSRKPDWAAGIYNEKEYTADHICNGKTALIAAMRCYVLSQLGDEIDVPEELSRYV